MWAPHRSRNNMYNSPAPLQAKGAGATSGFGVGSLHGRQASLLKGRQAAKGRHKLTHSQSRAAGAALPQNSIPAAIRARWCLVVPATSSSESCTSTWHPSANHSPSGTDSFASSAAGLVRGHKAAHCHHSSCEKPPQACEHPALPLQHRPPTITLQPPKVAAPLTGTAENRCVQLSQVTNQQISLSH